MTEVSLAGDPVNLETWMEDLPEQLKEVPLIYLAIPGSHDSMTYGITRQSGLAPDAEPEWASLFPLFRGTIMRWSITQALDTTGQLMFGIRYLDLRLSTKTGTEDFYFTHGLYAQEITRGLSDVKNFVDSHPGEVVILDAQHFYGFTAIDHQRLLRFFLNMYGARLVPRPLDLTSVTLSSARRMGQSVIIIYRHESAYSTSMFWQPQMFPSPWPRQDSVSGLINFMENVNRGPGIGFVHQAVLTPTAKFILVSQDSVSGLINFMENVNRGPGIGFVHQAVLTPTAKFILVRWVSSLKEKCAKPVVKNVVPKLVEFTPGEPRRTHPPQSSPVNVVIADFVELEDAIFPKTIIQLNFKLLRDSQSLHSSNG
ncbi:hypothetical protein NE865_09684 [Phthorimaea operculella]|nr:hypothetical protein NE865_09684 [Phthorimaea operculella]